MTEAAVHDVSERSAPPSALGLFDVSFVWPGRDGFELLVPKFELAPGETVLLTGPSGSGKSTLLSLISGIVAPDAGTVDVDGAAFSTLSGPRRDRFRAERFGVIFQQFNLLPFASAVENVLLQLTFAPERRKRVGSDPRREAVRLLTALGLPRSAVEAGTAAALSVGQQQRVAVARALIGGPRIVVADEPTSALDRDAQDAFLGLLFDQLAQTGATLLMVSHDPSLGARFDRVVALGDIARIRRGLADPPLEAPA